MGYCVLAAVRGGLFSWLNQRLIRRLRTRLFERLVRKETAFFDTNDVGSLTSRLGSDCFAVARCISTNLNVAMRNLLQVIGGWRAQGCGASAVLYWAPGAAVGAAVQPQCNATTGVACPHARYAAAGLCITGCALPLHRHTAAQHSSWQHTTAPLHLQVAACTCAC